ncbi:MULTISPECIES: 3-keto-disaccharide hydrolase [Rufibacter]|uniref:Uncharacterized protein YaiE (UPF0345 family) n=1 Tax=Rufibacter quisquiliarum TaxID=1549639 RepID=A0A839H1F0_9BACT|nr:MULTISPECIES: DUF1080 domain-containing protein [Rufibacter]MBA9079721.1 uncharacterized protein YaiE (UPF0345 family) [Rufibacter quisquiliarum]
MQLRKLLPFLSLAVLGACQSSQNTSMPTAQNSAKGGWQPLFDGKTTNGWHSYGKATIGKAWKVEDGALHLDAAAKKDWQTAEGGDIVSEQSFDNFHLKMDWKIAPKGNSGIILFVQDDPAKYKYVWHTGPEIQVLDNDGHPDAKIHKHRAGDLYDLIASSPETVKPAGEWNHVEIISQNNQLKVLQNGQQVLSTTMWDDNWRSMIAGSKFAKMEGFGAFKSGKIALQDHGDDVWFKNIMIKRL